MSILDINTDETTTKAEWMQYYLTLFNHMVDQLFEEIDEAEWKENTWYLWLKWKGCGSNNNCLSTSGWTIFVTGDTDRKRTVIRKEIIDMATKDKDNIPDVVGVYATSDHGKQLQMNPLFHTCEEHWNVPELVAKMKNGGIFHYRRNEISSKFH